MTGLSARALADAARAGKLPHYKIHGRRYMTLAQINEYVAARLVSRNNHQATPERSLRERIAAEAARTRRRRVA